MGIISTSNEALTVQKKSRIIFTDLNIVLYL